MVTENNNSKHETILSVPQINPACPSYNGNTSGISIPEITIPTTIHDLLAFYHRTPDALIYAGGTYLLKYQETKSIQFPKHILYIKKMEELNRISKTEKYIEIGCCVGLRKLLSLSKDTIPQVLHSILMELCPEHIKNLATIGGNICVHDKRLNGFLVLSILDAFIELRSYHNSRWIPINRLLGKSNMLQFKPGEILTKIRIPFDNWDLCIVKKVGRIYEIDSDQVTMIGLVKIDRAVVSDFRLAFGMNSPNIVRSKELENQFIGSRLPFSGKEKDSFFGFLHSLLTQQTYPLSQPVQIQILQCAKYFLSKIDNF